jgi:DNA-binding CsgD family transcriptional regulator
MERQPYQTAEPLAPNLLGASNRLTLREVEVLSLMSRGCSYKKVALVLGISGHTVAAHIKNAYRKLDVHCAGAAVMRAIELRLISIGASQ